MVWLIVITIIVLLVGANRLSNLFCLQFDGSEVLEKTWTIFPIIILVRIGVPRIWLLCALETVGSKPLTTVKVTSNQWNWQGDTFFSEERDHLLDADEIDNLGAFEIPLTLVAGVSRILVIRTDVLHSLGIPGLGVKLDSVPGRLNSVALDANAPGLFPGSCYELCGRGHRVIPIVFTVI